MHRLITFVRASLDLFVKTLAIFALANVLIAAVAPSYACNWLWIQGSPVPSGLVTLILIGFGLSTLLRTKAARGFTFAVAGICLLDAISYWSLLDRGEIQSSVGVPMSAGIAALLLGGVVFPRMVIRGRARRWLGRVAVVAAVSMMLVSCVWVHLTCFGESNYRREADAAVVFGCKVNVDGRPSGALLDRTRTACDLYNRGLVSQLVFSGGHTPGTALSEPECMKRIAVRAGVPEHAIVLDLKGATTRDTLDEVARLSKHNDWTRVLMVSHDYHLARIKLACKRRGIAGYTVPAVETVPWPGKPLAVMREITAFGWYVIKA